MRFDAELEFRRLELGHLDALLEIEQLSFSQPWSRDSYTKELSLNRLAHYYGLFCGAQLLAFAGFWQIFEEGHIANVAVHPQARGQGLGKLLLTNLIAVCKSLGGSWMTLEVRESNQAARALYRGLGFAEMGKRPHYYTDNNEDAVIMWLNMDERMQDGQNTGN